MELFLTNPITNASVLVNTILKDSTQYFYSIIKNEYLIKLHDIDIDDIQCLFKIQHVNQEITILYDSIVSNLYVTQNDIVSVISDNVIINKLMDKVNITKVMELINYNNNNKHEIIKNKLYLINSTMKNIFNDNELKIKTFQISQYCNSYHKDNYTYCITSNLIDNFKNYSELIYKDNRYNDGFTRLLSNRYRDYVCNDTNLNTTIPLYTYIMNITSNYNTTNNNNKWENSDNNNEINYNVSVLLNRNQSKVWLINNFITKEVLVIF